MSSEKELKKLKKVVELRELAKDVLDGPFEMSDIYLLRWLRKHKFDAKKANAAIRKYKSWDVKILIDSGCCPDYPDIEADFPIHECGFDRENCPVVLVRLGQVNVDKYTDLKMKEEVLLCAYKKLEDGVKRVTREKYDPDNPTDIRVISILDMEGFTLKKYLNKDYIKIGIDMLKILESHYPYMGKSFHAVNVPSTRLVNLLLNTLKPFMDADTISRIHIHGRDINSWKHIIKDLVPDYQTQYPQDFVEILSADEEVSVAV